MVRVYNRHETAGFQPMNIVSVEWTDGFGDVEDTCEVIVDGINPPHRFTDICIVPTQRDIRAPIFGPYQVESVAYDFQKNQTTLHGRIGLYISNRLVSDRNTEEILSQIPFVALYSIPGSDTRPHSSIEAPDINAWVPWFQWGRAVIPLTVDPDTMKPTSAPTSNVGASTLAAHILEEIRHSTSMSSLRSNLGRYGLTAYVEVVWTGGVPKEEIRVVPLFPTLSSGTTAQNYTVQSIVPRYSASFVQTWRNNRPALVSESPENLNHRQIKIEPWFTSLWPEININDIRAAVGTSPGADLFAERQFQTSTPQLDAQVAAGFKVGQRAPIVFMSNQGGTSFLDKLDEEVQRWKLEHGFMTLIVDHIIEDIWTNATDFHLIPGMVITFDTDDFPHFGQIGFRDSPLMFVQRVDHSFVGGQYIRTITAIQSQRSISLFPAEILEQAS